MSFLKVALGCALVFPLSSLACGGTEGEPDAPDAASHDAKTPPKVKHDASAATDTGKPDAGRVDAGGDVGTVATDAQQGTEDAPVDAGPRDHGEASTTYPAFTPFVPQIQYGDGPVLSDAEIVTITWSGDPNAQSFEDFGDDIGTGDYWRETTSEYKINPAHSGPADHIELPATEVPVASWSDVDVAAWVTDHVTNAQMYGWPAPTNNTLYTLYASPQTDILYNGASACDQGIGGYHDNVAVNGQDVAYAVVLQCQTGGGGGGGGSFTTALASHEIIEAATDPHPQDITGWIGFDSDHLAWDVFQSFQDEVGDACEFYFDAFFDETFPIAQAPDGGVISFPDAGDGGLPFGVGTTTFAAQRTWSNANAAAGHAPCRPTDYPVYFNVSPLDLDASVTINGAAFGAGANLQGQGYRIAKGATRTFPVGFWSDGPTSGPWTLSAVEGNPLLGPNQTSHLTISIDQPTGQNGDIAYVTVTVNAVDTTMNGELVTISSQLSGFHRTFVPILISNE